MTLELFCVTIERRAMLSTANNIFNFKRLYVSISKLIKFNTYSAGAALIGFFFSSCISSQQLAGSTPRTGFANSDAPQAPMCFH